MNAELSLAKEAAVNAGELILNYYKADYEIRDKGYQNPVTTADHASDAFLKDTLTKAYPEYGWLSEETVDSKERLSKKRVWVVDPLDGTKEFIEGVPHFVVSIALVESGIPIVGVLYNPVTAEMFSASKGNDLITPVSFYQFSGLKEGDKWCLCVKRWIEAEEAGKAPKLILEATHEKTLEYISLKKILKYAVR